MSDDGIARLAALERSLRRVRIAFGSTLALALAGFAASWQASGRPEVLRARGLVIVDDAGRERILLGAPVPAAPERVRKDAGAALVFLQPDGKERLLVGENSGCVIDGSYHEREREYGLLIHDSKGDERGGIGCFDSGKAVVALDRGRPYMDAVALMVDDSIDFAGVVVSHRVKEAYVQALCFGTQKGASAFNMDDADGRRRLQIELPPEGAPRFDLYDEDGKLQRDALAEK